VVAPRFYFTLHPGDMLRARIIPGSYIMLVAAAHWDNARQRFKVRRPPIDHVASMCIDSGGFTAARRWGKYPWTVEQYVDFIRAVSRDIKLDFCSILDYACEPSVNRSAYQTNIERIEATIENEIACRKAAPDLPWLPILQGDSLEERQYDLDRRRELGLLPTDYAGIGSVCGRGAGGAAQVVKFYADRLPGVQYHGFGMHIQALDDDTVYAALRSWDSYSWTWGRGQTEIDRPPEYYWRKGEESYSTYTRRMAELYWKNTIQPRLIRARQITLW
jgi:hypothetical protein